MGYAFISYKSENKKSADAIRKIFCENGIGTWMAPYNIPDGNDYAKEITNGIRNCSCFVVLLTKISQDSGNVVSEVNLANHFKKPFVIIQLEDMILNDTFLYYVNHYHISKIYTINEKSTEMQKVLASVKKHIGQPFSDSIKSENGSKQVSKKSESHKKLFIYWAISIMSIIMVTTGLLLFSGIADKISTGFENDDHTGPSKNNETSDTTAITDTTIGTTTTNDTTTEKKDDVDNNYYKYKFISLNIEHYKDTIESKSSVHIYKFSTTEKDSVYRFYLKPMIPEDQFNAYTYTYLYMMLYDSNGIKIEEMHVHCKDEDFFDIYRLTQNIHLKFMVRGH